MQDSKKKRRPVFKPFLVQAWTKARAGCPTALGHPGSVKLRLSRAREE